MKYSFLILSNQSFDQDLKTNKWHIATRLAKRGHDVVFVDPPLRFKALKDFLKKPSLNLSKLFARTEMKSEHLTVYKPANIFNFKPFSIINTSFHYKFINKLLNKGNPAIVWVYHFDFPDLENFLSKLDYDLLIYDVVDEYTAFPEYSMGKRMNTGLVSVIQNFDEFLKVRLNQKGLSGVKWVLHREEWLAKNADLMFASAPGLVLKFKNWREEIHYLPNAAAVEKFDIYSKNVKEPVDLKNIPRPRIGFTGAIDSYKISIPLVVKCAEKYPNYHFIMIGPEKLSDPDSDLSKAKALKNVHFLGIKPWEETPSYFAHFDTYFIPTVLNDYTLKGHFPVKYFEALAAGLATVVVDIGIYDGIDVDGYVSKGDEEFIANIKKALDEDSSERRKKRKELARKNSWDKKVDKQLALINNALSDNKK